VDLRDAIAAARAGWFLPLIGLLFGAALAAAMSLLVTPQYTASSQLFVSTTDGTSTQAAYQGSQFSEGRVQSYVQLLTSEQLAERVIASMGLSMTPHELQDQVVATAVPDTVVLSVEVTNPSPERARDLVAAIDSQFTAIVTELETPTTNSTVTVPGSATTQASSVPVKVAVIDAPDVATAPSSPQLYFNIAVGAVVGLVIGFLGAYLRVRLDQSVRDPELAAALTGAPVMGLITRDPVLEKQHVLEPNSQLPIAEGFRQLRTNLQFVDVDHPPKVILVTSAVAGEGKTTMALNLAVTLAEGGDRVTLVEADLRRPRITRYLGLVGGAGLTNVLVGNADLEDMLQPVGDSALTVIAAGPTPPNPSQLLASAQMQALITELRATSDFVIIDAPPLLPVSDASGAAVLVDGVLLSVHYGVTRRDQLEQAAATLDRVGAKMLGIVLNLVPVRAGVSDTYGYGDPYEVDRERRNDELVPAASGAEATGPQAGGHDGRREKRRHRHDGRSAPSSADAEGGRAEPVDGSERGAGAGTPAGVPEATGAHAHVSSSSGANGAGSAKP